MGSTLPEDWRMGYGLITVILTRVISSFMLGIRSEGRLFGDRGKAGELVEKSIGPGRLRFDKVVSVSDTRFS